MLFSRKLITKFIPDFVNITDEKLTQAVNSLGMEVESITKHQPINNVVIGQLISYRPVEGTHLNLCQVKISSTQTNTIVCGASGLVEGKKVIVALSGAKLPNGVTIEKRVIHGMESNGMICAYPELTGSDAYLADAEKDEIIMLDEGRVGETNWPELIGLDDTIYDVTVPANRNDENAYLVFCFELANKLGLKFKFDIKNTVGKLPQSQNNIVAKSSSCSFLAFLDYHVSPSQVARSTWDVKAMLMNHGIKPINQILDTLSYITLLTNCPTHVYDANKLQGSMNCRNSNSELKFVALNGKTYTLAANDILICDQAQPVSIASVIGSDSTKLLSKTTRARIEIGNFNYAQVRTTAIRLNCETDASKKASRPLSNFLNLVALQLIKETFGVPLMTQLWYRPNWNAKQIKLDYKTLAWFINEPLSHGFVISSLKKLGYDANLLLNKFKAPAWRLDVENQEDMFEDILKIIDMNKLKSISVADNLLPVAENIDYDIKQNIKNILLNNYFSEVKTYNLTNKNNLEKFNLFKAKDPIKIMCNNSNREYFRFNLLDAMLKVYKYNDARKLQLHPIFEIQKIFTNKDKTTNITCLSLNKYLIDNITGSGLATNVNYFKAIANEIAKVLNAKISFVITQVNDFYSNETIGISYKNNIIGYIGKIKASSLKNYDLSNKQIYALTMNIDKLIDDYKKLKFVVKPFGIFQKLSKDVNIILEQANIHLVNEKIQQIKNIKDIEDVKIINIFNKDNKTIYTVRYYLVDTRQFTANDLELISKQIENLSNL